MRRLVLALLVAGGGAAKVIWWPAAEPPTHRVSQEVFPHEAHVRRIIDGDTVQLEDGQLLRYIGIDTPESRRRRGNHWITDPQPFAREATEINRRLVEGRTVRLEQDVQPRDRYGRWLAYVYVTGSDGAELMVNEELVRQGVAQPMTIPPNVKFAETFRALAAEARQAKRGLWSD